PVLGGRLGWFGVGRPSWQPRAGGPPVPARCEPPCPSPRLFEDFTPDQHTADFARAGADLVKFCIAQQAAGRVLIGITIAAQTLDGFESHPGGALGGVKDRAGGVLTRGFATVASSSDCVKIGLRR